MNSGTKLLLALLVLAGAAFLVYSVWSGSDDHPMSPISPVATPTPDDKPAVTPVEPEVAPIARTPTPDSDLNRESVNDRPSSSADAAQGVKGRVVDAFGAPVTNAEVFLFEGHGANLFEAMMQSARGIQNPPAASMTVESDGTFQLGVRNLPSGKSWELRVISVNHADFVKANLTIFPEQWHDAGTITLANGIVVQGVVTSLVTGRPVADATVLLRPANQTMVSAPTPGREQGIEVRTDANGAYRYENATAGIVTVAAFAPEHARVERANQNVRADAENRFDFELPAGKSIAGIVTDGAQPVARARLQILAISSKNPITVETSSDRDGRFEALGLVDGPYQILVTAAGFVRADEKPVMAGEVNKEIVLEKQGSVRVRVTAKNGRLLNRYTILVKGYNPEPESYSNLLQVPAMDVGPRDLDDGFYTVSGLDPGNFALEVNATGFAKSYSAPFSVTVGGQPQDLLVELSEGGAMMGVIVGEDGRGLGQVQLATLPNDFEDNALAAMFEPMIPYKITKLNGKTNPDGRFKLDKLTPGTYQLRLTHGEHYTVFQKDIVVEEGRTVDIGQIRMMRGTELVGTVQLDGAPAGQMKVQVSARPDPTGRTRNNFSAIAISDDQGRFVIPKRLPPGDYTANAGRQENPFQMIVDFNQTKQDFSVGQGQPQHQLHFRIQSQ